MNLFRVKICGVTSAEAVITSAAAGVDAIGLNCFPKSKRYLPPEFAETVARAIPLGVVRVGVFVNEQIDTVRRLADQLDLDLIQLHGDEDAEYASQLGGRPYLRAFRFDESRFMPIVDFLSATAALGCSPTSILVDAHVSGEYGGTGAKADWAQVAAEKNQLGEIKLILAGGLTPDNVAEAIATVDPYGVDTASGVESAPGVKHTELAALFVKRAKAALRI